VFVITISAPLLARELWQFGEPELAGRVLALPPEAMADICFRSGELAQAGDVERLWPVGPNYTAKTTILAATEYLEGQARPATRNRRLPLKGLPAHLAVSEAEEARASGEVSAEVNRRMWNR
jgi:hypothetical protein